MGGAIERAHSIAKNLIRVALTRLRLPLETLQIHCRYYLLKLYNFVNINHQFCFLYFYVLFMVLFKVHFYFDKNRFKITISGTVYY